MEHPPTSHWVGTACPSPLDFNRVRLRSCTCSSPARTSAAPLYQLFFTAYLPHGICILIPPKAHTRARNRESANSERHERSAPTDPPPVKQGSESPRNT